MNLSDYQRAYDATMREAVNPNPEKSFISWQRDAAGTRGALQRVVALYERDRAQILSDYSSTKAAEMLADLQENLLAVRRTAKNAIKARLDEVVESKREQIKQASKAPSDEDLRLLQALSLRSSLTDSDVIHAAEAMGDSLVAMGTLADIAHSKGVNLPIPTPAGLEQELDDAIRFANDMVKSIDVPDEELSYAATCFYLHPGISDGPARIAFDNLDRSRFTVEGIENRSTDPNEGSNSER